MLVSDIYQGTLMFRSENNVLAASELTPSQRRHHDFLDDLESLFWVYIWIIMVQNGPGQAAFISKPCSFIVDSLGAARLTQLHAAKYLYMRNFTDKDLAVVTPYFSHPPYLELVDNLRDLLNEYNSPKNRGENLFPHLDEIYGKYLAHFDSAIKQLGGHLAAPLETVKSKQDVVALTPLPAPLRRIQPARSAKRPRDDCEDHLAIRGAKRSRPLPRGRILREDAKPPPTLNPLLTRPEGTRRSARIREREARKTSIKGTRRKKLGGSQRVQNGVSIDGRLFVA